MAQFLLRQLGSVFFTLLIVSGLSFYLIHWAPGGPYQQTLERLALSGEELSPAHLEMLSAQYGFDKPILYRYGTWLSKVLSLDFGESFLFKSPVVQVMAGRMATTAKYGLFALPICYLLAFVLSLFLVSKSWKIVQIVFLTFLLGLYVVPPVILALWFRYQMPILSDFGIVILYVLTHLTLMVLLFRGALLQEMGKPYNDVARSKGLSRLQVSVYHQLPNSLIPIVTSLSYSLLAFFAGSLFIESVFSIQGLGQLSFLAAQARDYNLMMGIVLLLSALFVVSRALSQILYWWVDPRLRRVENE